MKKILSVLTCCAFLLAANGLFNPTTLDARTTATDYEWGTFEVIAGIATCDGPADNCTKPVRQAPQPVEGGQMT